MKNKGFVFVETIIVTTVITVALLSIYTSFLNILTNEKRRATYNDTEYLYRTYYIEDFISSLNIDQYIADNLQDKSIAEFNCDAVHLYNMTKNDLTNNTTITDQTEVAKKAYCETIINKKRLNNQHIYITKYDVSDLKKCTSSDGKVTDCDSKDLEVLKNVSTNFIYYLRTLSASDEDKDSYRLIVEYEEKDYDDTLTKDIVDGKCENTYEIVNGKCTKVVTKNYYSSVKLVVNTSY